MKREGRQRGMVRTYPVLSPALNPRPDEPRHVNMFNTPPTAGLFTRVSTKPTNHSKFTGKCGLPKCSACHLHPASKAKVKTKGNHKVTSLTFLMGSGKGSAKFSGVSATAILEDLSGERDCEHDHDQLDQDDYEVDQDYQESDDLIIYSETSSLGVGIVDEDDYADEDMSDMSFCDVALIWEQVEIEDWYIVDDM